MDEREFTELYDRCSTEVADEFYPKGLVESAGRRGEYLRDQAVLAVKLVDELKAANVIADEHA